MTIRRRSRPTSRTRFAISSRARSSSCPSERRRGIAPGGWRPADAGYRAVAKDPLSPFHEPVRDWFRSSLGAPTRAQALGWPAIARGESTLLLAPTGSGKTLAAFLSAIDRLMWSEEPP